MQATNPTVKIVPTVKTGSNQDNTSLTAKTAAALKSAHEGESLLPAPAAATAPEPEPEPAPAAAAAAPAAAAAAPAPEPAAAAAPAPAPRFGRRALAVLAMLAITAVLIKLGIDIGPPPPPGPEPEPEPEPAPELNCEEILQLATEGGITWSGDFPIDDLCLNPINILRMLMETLEGDNNADFFTIPEHLASATKANLISYCSQMINPQNP